MGSRKKQKTGSFLIKRFILEFELASQDYLYELFQRYSTEWNLNVIQIQNAVKLALLDEVNIEIVFDKLRLFLYAKGMYANEEYENERIAKFDAILNHKTHSLTNAFNRLNVIVQTGEITPASSPVNTPESTPTKQKEAIQASPIQSTPPRSFFDAFVSQHPEWGIEYTLQ